MHFLLTLERRVLVDEKKDDREKSSESALTDMEKLCLSIGSMALDEQQWEELWIKYPDKARDILIRIGAEQLGLVDPIEEES